MLYLAVELAERFIAPRRENPPDPAAALDNLLLRMALERVDWEHVARALLRHFTLPVLLASPDPDRPRPARFAWSPAAWKGNVN